MNGFLLYGSLCLNVESCIWTACYMSGIEGVGYQY